VAFSDQDYPDIGANSGRHSGSVKHQAGVVFGAPKWHF
jgi:hypothetical protein